MPAAEIENFLAMMAAQKGASKRTIEAYEYDLRQFLEYCDFADNKYPEKEQIESFMQYLGAHGYAPKSLARKLSAVKEFCKFLYSEHIIKTNPSQNIVTPKQYKPLPKFLTYDDIQLLIEAAYQNAHMLLQSYRHYKESMLFSA